MKAIYVFKVKYDVQNDSELQLAEAELKGLTSTEFSPIRNLTDLFISEPFSNVLRRHETVEPRIQDVLTRLPYPGSAQAYIAYIDIQDCWKLFKRLSYFRDFFVIGSEISATSLVEALFPNINVNKRSEKQASFQQLTPYLQVWELANNTWIRVIPLHIFQECSEHVGRLARKTADVDRMFSMTLKHFSENFSRPFVPSVNVGFKWIEDFIDDRRAPMAYITHGFFGLRGRFFPRMIRALINYLEPADDKVLLDPFCGVGTLGIEATLMGLDSINLDINPLFTFVSKVKTDSLKIDISRLRTQIEGLLEVIQEPVFFQCKEEDETYVKGDLAVSNQTIQFPPSLSRGIKPESVNMLQQILEAIDTFDDATFKEFARVPLIYAGKSMLKKYTPKKILTSYWGYLWRMFYSLYFYSKLGAEVFQAPLGNADFYTHDIRGLREFVHEKADLIITSPPYATAVDYVGNDSHSLYLLGLTKDHLSLDRSTIGSLKAQSSFDNLEQVKLPACVVEPIYKILSKNSKRARAIVSYYEDMYTAFSQMRDSLKSDKRLAIIIGSEQDLPSDGTRIRLPLAESMKEVALASGLDYVEEMKIELAKNTYGSIFSESILVFRK